MSPSPSPSALFVITVGLPTGERYEFGLDGPSFTVGRNARCDLQLPSRTVSSVHARFEVREDGQAFVVTDLGSKNGTRVGGRNLLPRQPTTLDFGSPVVIADTELVVRPQSNGVSSLSHSLEQSKSFSRVFVRGLLGRAAHSSRASLEVIRGSARGRIFWLDETQDEFSIGYGPEVDFDLGDPRLAGSPITIRHKDQAYFIEPHPRTSIRVGVRSIRSATQLRSGNRLRISHSALRFVDPLQAAIDALDLDEPEVEAGKAGEVLSSVAASAPEMSCDRRRWTILDVALLVFAVLAVVVGIGLLVLLFATSNS